MTPRPASTTRRRLLTVGAGLATAAIAGCVGARQDPDYTPPTPTSAPPEAREEGQGGSGPELTSSATVNMVSGSDGSQVFEPAVVWLEAGGTVTWVNDSGAHTTTAYAEANDKPSRIPADAEGWDSGMVTEVGDEFSHTFEVEGVYDYFCLPHEALAMVGTVVVGDPDPADQPGLAEPQSSLPGEAPSKLAELNAEVSEQL